jgi:hypothetical protein
MWGRAAADGSNERHWHHFQTWRAWVQTITSQCDGGQAHVV